MLLASYPGPSRGGASSRPLEFSFIKTFFPSWEGRKRTFHPQEPSRGENAAKADILRCLEGKICGVLADAGVPSFRCIDSMRIRRPYTELSNGRINRNYQRRALRQKAS